MTWDIYGSIVGVPVGFACMMYIILSRKKKVDVTGKVVLVTGASSGLGKACADVFYKAGCRVILAGRDMTKLQQVKEELEQKKFNAEGDSQLDILSLDLENLQSIPGKAEEALNKFGRIDILVNNAGISYRGCIEATSIDVDMKLMTVNYFGHVALTKALLPHLTGGHIVTISTLQGRFAIPYRSAYSASKHALQAFFDSLRAEVNDRNIHVCVVTPGYIQTNLSHNALCGDGSKYGVMDDTTSSGLKPEQVANSILDAVIWREDEIIPAQFVHKLVISLRTLAPGLYFWIMNKRAKNQRKLYIKNS